jgi:hypothetical protein
MRTRFTPEELEDITSERFIHRDLRNRAAGLAEEVREVWKKNFKVDTYAITWPSETVKGDDGIGITQAVLMFIPDTFTEEQKLDALKKMVVRTKAYGVALIEKKGLEIRVLFETHHGARAWLIPLERHGDVAVPGETQVRDDAEHLGLLWSPTRGTS